MQLKRGDLPPFILPNKLSSRHQLTLQYLWKQTQCSLLFVDVESAAEVNDEAHH